MKTSQLIFKILPSICLFVLSLVILIFDLHSVPCVLRLRDILFGATIWQACVAFSSMLKVVSETDSVMRGY